MSIIIRNLLNILLLLMLAATPLAFFNRNGTERLELEQYLITIGQFVEGLFIVYTRSSFTPSPY